MRFRPLSFVVQNEREKGSWFCQKGGGDRSELGYGPHRHVLCPAGQPSIWRSARASVEKAVEFNPDDALAWARLAELWSSFGRLSKALDAAKKAVAFGSKPRQNPDGFRLRLPDPGQDCRVPRAAFDKGHRARPGRSPLSRLGLGLAIDP